MCVFLCVTVCVCGERQGRKGLGGSTRGRGGGSGCYYTDSTRGVLYLGGCGDQCPPLTTVRHPL